MDLFNDLGRALEQGLQNAGTFLETNSALLANTLALDKLSEFDGTEARTSGPTRGCAPGMLAAWQHGLRARPAAAPSLVLHTLTRPALGCTPVPPHTSQPSR